MQHFETNTFINTDNIIMSAGYGTRLLSVIMRRYGWHDPP